MEERDLNQELKETKRYYENARLELSKIVLSNVLIEEKHTEYINENGEKVNTLEYGVYIKFKGENIKIATIDESGKFEPNTDLLKDEKYSQEELDALGDMLNRLGLEQDKVDINKIKQQLQEIDAKTEEQLKHETGEKEREAEETIKDDEVKNEKDDEEKDKDKEELDKQQAEETKRTKLAKLFGVRTKDIVLIKPTAEIFKNHPELPKSTFLVRHPDGKTRAYEFDSGRITKSKFIEDSETGLITKYVNIGSDGENIKKEIPYQVMKTNLKARNTQEIRMATRIEQGYFECEEIRQGTNGEWTGYGVERIGRDDNRKIVNQLSSTRTNNVEPADISDRYEGVKNTGLADDGVQIQDLSPMATIERFMEEGYNKKEAVDIYNYMIGPEHLSEEASKERVNSEIIERIEENERQVEDDEKTPWNDAENRRRRG